MLAICGTRAIYDAQAFLLGHHRPLLLFVQSLFRQQLMSSLHTFVVPLRRRLSSTIRRRYVSRAAWLSAHRVSHAVSAPAGSVALFWSPSRVGRRPSLKFHGQSQSSRDYDYGDSWFGAATTSRLWQNHTSGRSLSKQVETRNVYDWLTLSIFPTSFGLLSLCALPSHGLEKLSTSFFHVSRCIHIIGWCSTMLDTIVRYCLSKVVRLS